MTNNRMYFYIDAQQQRQGPVEARRLPLLGVTYDSYVWTEGMPDWDRVENIRELDELYPPKYSPKSTICESARHPELFDDSSVTNEPSILEEPQYDEKSAVGWLVATYIFALLGGYLGFICGFAVYFTKEKVLDPRTQTYEKVPKYKKSHRILGLIGAILAIISIFVWKFAIL